MGRTQTQFLGDLRNTIINFSGVIDGIGAEDKVRRHALLVAVSVENATISDCVSITGQWRVLRALQKAGLKIPSFQPYDTRRVTEQLSVSITISDAEKFVIAQQNESNKDNRSVQSTKDDSGGTEPAQTSTSAGSVPGGIVIVTDDGSVGKGVVGNYNSVKSLSNQSTTANAPVEPGVIKEQQEQRNLKENQIKILGKLAASVIKEQQEQINLKKNQIKILGELALKFFNKDCDQWGIAFGVRCFALRKTPHHIVKVRAVLQKFGVFVQGSDPHRIVSYPAKNFDINLCLTTIQNIISDALKNESKPFWRDFKTHTLYLEMRQLFKKSSLNSENSHAGRGSAYKASFK